MDINRMKEKYGPTRFDGLNFYERKMMIHHRVAKHNPLVWSGYLDGCDMTALTVVSPHLFVFQPEKRHMHVRTECQAAQVVCGARTKHVGLSHREFMPGIRSYVQNRCIERLDAAACCNQHSASIA